MIIDADTPEGQVRLRIGDVSDLPYLPDTVITSTLNQSNGNVPAAAKKCAVYILGMLTHKTHRKMGLQLEVWGSEEFANYKAFLLLTMKDPAFMELGAFLPYGSSAEGLNAMQQFQSDWNRNYYRGTQSQLMAVTAELSPNDGSRYGPYGLCGTWSIP